MIASFLGSPWPPPLYFVCAIFLREIIVHKVNNNMDYGHAPPSRAHAHESIFIARSLVATMHTADIQNSKDANSKCMPKQLYH